MGWKYFKGKNFLFKNFILVFHYFIEIWFAESESARYERKIDIKKPNKAGKSKQGTDDEVKTKQVVVSDVETESDVDKLEDPSEAKVKTKAKKPKKKVQKVTNEVDDLKTDNDEAKKTIKKTKKLTDVKVVD